MNVFKKILIVTDNSLIASRFIAEVIPELKGLDAVFNFCCSPFSNPDFFKLNGFEVLVRDLRDDDEALFISENYDLVISLHCKQLFPKNLLESVRCINVHPGYNPENRGWYPQVFAILKDTVIGATIHEIDEQLDHGPIIAQEIVPKYSFDTSLTLYNRVVNKELDLLKSNIIDIINDTYVSKKCNEEGTVHFKKDFNKLCELDLSEKLTMGEALNKLRALSHGSYKNAFYLDEDTGKKIYVTLNMDCE